ncbi:hypothetical protein HO173_003343 [Letharia columbiana]|uniref:Uncharacterized protein n=1 Tax=Letharia columbiana TaxID=112416 RepID=A0A8H6G1N1_9LECA|nr:uncharacterized protein HO173_003343 [Letharia columbiana]KAF6238836.1 hypothetical protein HO173_003343 [Letharia columbiana]
MATIVKNTAQLSKIPRHMLSTVPHQIITQQAENTTATWPVIPTALRSKRRNYNRQMRRTLRRNQAATRPLSSRTRLSSPRSHVISVIHGSTSNHHSASGEHHCNLACHPYYINMVYHCNDVTRGGSTATITANWASAGGTSDDTYLDELKPSDVLL